MTEQIIANLASMIILLAILGFFIKRWMDNLEKKVDSLCNDMHTKVDKSYCEIRKIDESGTFREIWNWLKYHTHTSEGYVIVPKRD